MNAARGILTLMMVGSAACGANGDSGAAHDTRTDASGDTLADVVVADATSPPEIVADSAVDTTPDLGPEIEPHYRAGYVTVTTTAITGQRGNRLIITGQDGQSRLCVAIDADPFTLAPTRMQLHEGIPCAPPGDELLFFGGEVVLSAGVFAPGSVITETIVSERVLVDGDVAVTFDGAALSR